MTNVKLEVLKLVNAEGPMTDLELENLQVWMPLGVKAETVRAAIAELHATRHLCTIGQVLGRMLNQLTRNGRDAIAKGTV